MRRRFLLSCGAVLMLLPAWVLAAALLTPFEPDSMPAIAAQHKGKPFVLVVWSLDCIYCQASLENLSQAQGAGKAPAIVTVSTDALDDPQAFALMNKRLDKLGLTRNAWAFGSASSDRLRYAIDPKWHGEKPRSYWFNARGERIAYSGVLNTAVIDKLYRQVSK